MDRVSLRMKEISDCYLELAKISDKAKDVIRI